MFLNFNLYQSQKIPRITYISKILIFTLIRLKNITIVKFRNSMKNEILIYYNPVSISR